MWCPRAANWTIAMGVALGAVAATQADGPPRPLRPQPKIIVYQPPTDAPATVAVMGQVALPGIYQFPQAPTLAEVVQTAKGLKPAASPMIRIVRGNRVAQRVSLTTAATEKLLAGDLVIVDTQPFRDHASGATAKEPDGVQLALLGVVDRPIVVKVESPRARLETIIQMLGQSPANSAVKVIPPPNALRDSSGVLPDGSVLLFDPRRIQVAELPDDLPKIIPCDLPEPDIGGYGVHHAIEERRRAANSESAAEGATPWNSSPQTDELSEVPSPGPGANSQASPTLIPDDRLPATLSSTLDERSPISRVPFSGRPSKPAEPTRLSASPPTQTAMAPDAQEPAWNNIGSAETDPVPDADAELAGTPPATAGLSLRQLASVVTTLALIGGFIIAIRARQATQARRRSRRGSAPERTAQALPASESHHGTRRGSSAVIPSPHIPLAGFAAALIPTNRSRALPVSESRDDRDLIFRGILKNELPLMEEALVVRPGLKISLPNEESTFRRLDDMDSSLPGPHRSMAVAPQISAVVESNSERLIIDPPHTGRSSVPHRRTATEAPVDRALRQLQGGAR